MAKRVYLHAPNRDGHIEYPAAGFYQNVPDELADKWVADRLAQYATDDNVAIPWPEPEKTEDQPANAEEGK